MSEMQVKFRQGKLQSFTKKMEMILEGNIETDGVLGPAIIYTDTELVELVNSQLGKEQQISIKTFKKWKSGDMPKAHNSMEAQIIERFAECYRRALMEQKKNLFDAMAADVPGGWQKWAWIIERKFREWNPSLAAEDDKPKPKALVFRKVGDSE